MAVLFSGSQTAVINTKHQLATSTSAATFVIKVDTGNMALGDELELTIDTAIESSGTHYQEVYAVYAHTQADRIKASIPIVAPYGYTCHLKQTAGTGRVFKWFVSSL